MREISRKGFEARQRTERARTRQHEHDPERYSARQDVKMKMGGFVGEVQYVGEVREFFPLLKLGEKLHVGKATGFGLGRYEVLHRVS